MEKIIVIRDWLQKRNMTSAIEMLELAIKNHEGQTRDEGTPYIEHPIDVALYLIENDFNNSIIISLALGHDIVEDTTVTIQDIEAKFGRFMAFLIGGLTKQKHIKNEIYYNNMFTDLRLCTVKAADRLINIRSLKLTNQAKQLRYKKQTHNQFIPFLNECANNFPRYETYFNKVRNEIITLLDEIKN